jgi:hypothetical protein
VRSADELMADRRWRLKHSIYLGWVIAMLPFVGLLYTGLRARQRSWLLWGAAYGVLFCGVVAIPPGEWLESGASYVVDALGIGTWIVSGVHLVLARHDWLRWKAHHKTEAVRSRRIRVIPTHRDQPSVFDTKAPATAASTSNMRQDPNCRCRAITSRTRRIHPAEASVVAPDDAVGDVPDVARLAAGLVFVVALPLPLFLLAITSLWKTRLAGGGRTGPTLACGLGVLTLWLGLVVMAVLLEMSASGAVLLVI